MTQAAIAAQIHQPLDTFIATSRLQIALDHVIPVDDFADLNDLMRPRSSFTRRS